MKLRKWKELNKEEKIQVVKNAGFFLAGVGLTYAGFKVYGNVRNTYIKKNYSKVMYEIQDLGEEGTTLFMVIQNPKTGNKAYPSYGVKFKSTEEVKNFLTKAVETCDEIIKDRDADIFNNALEAVVDSIEKGE